MKLKDNYLLILILVCICIFFSNLGALPVNIMEARNFGTAREMVELDHWLLTTFNNEPRFEKPPLPTWFTAFVMILSGSESLFILRLPAAIMGTIMVVFIYRLGADLSSHRIYSFISALIAATSFYILYSGRDGQWDIHAHAWAVVAIYYACKNFQKQKIKYVLLSGICLGFSFLSKGPIAFYALVIPFLIAYTLVFDKNLFLAHWKFLISICVIALFIAAPWYLYAYLHNQESFLKILSTETNRWIYYDTKAFYYYWSFFVQSGVWSLMALISLCYPYLKNRVFNKKYYRFTLIWTLVSVILLSLVPEKKSRYLLPVLVPLALNTGFYIEYLFRNFHTLDVKERWPVYLNFVLIAFAGISFPIVGYIYFENRIQDLWIWYILLSISLLGISFAMLYFLKKLQIKKVFNFSIVFIICILLFGLPMAKYIEQNPEYVSIKKVDEYSENGRLKIYEIRGFTPEMIWDYGKPISIIWDGRQYQIPKHHEFLVLATQNEETIVNRLFSEFKIEKLDEINMNPVGSKHKDRLFRNIFKISKKHD